MTIFLELPVEIWHMIIDWLNPWDALQLRQSCRQIWRHVTGHQAYWYRRFCWLMIRQKKRPAMLKSGCRRYHKKSVLPGMNCLSLQQELRLCQMHQITFTELKRRIKADPDKMLKNIKCSNANHYIYEIPQAPSKVSLDTKDYDPNTQLYLFRYLIHNYRAQRQSISRYDLKTIETQQKTVRKELQTKRRIIDQCRREMNRIKERDAWLQSVQQQLKRLEKNKVFYGKKSRQYRGLLQSPNEEKNLNKKNKFYLIS